MAKSTRNTSAHIGSQKYRREGALPGHTRFEIPCGLFECYEAHLELRRQIGSEFVVKKHEKDCDFPSAQRDDLRIALDIC